MYKRFFIGIIIFLVWIVIINIGNVYDYINYLEVEIYPYDVEYPLGLWDYFLLYIDYSFLVFNSIIEKQFFILIIYLSMLLTLISQLYLFIFSKANKEAIEFNLNIPPLLGVIGTIYAFASFIAIEQDTGDIIVVLKENFNSAAMTTILGGITYTINFLVLVVDEHLKKV